MPTITVIRMVNTTSDSLKARNVFIFQHFSFYEELKFLSKRDDCKTGNDTTRPLAGYGLPPPQGEFC